MDFIQLWRHDRALSKILCSTIPNPVHDNKVKVTDFEFFFVLNLYSVSGTKWIKSCLLQCFGSFKMSILMFISILVFRPEGQIWNPVRRDTRIYVRRILNASRINKTQLNSSTISPS